MITDVNINLHRWPFRRLPLDDTSKLVQKLQQSGITSAWAGSFDGVLHQDVADVNLRTVAECQQLGDGVLLPVGTINPTLPDWSDDVRRCRQDHGMQVVRITPGYHGYKLDDPVFEQLLNVVDEQHLILQLALKMEDVRTHHPLMMVPTVDHAPLAKLLVDRPQLPVILMNMDRLIGSDAATLTKAGNVYFEISHAEQVGALEKVIRDVPYERLLFGSHAPFFYLESALLKFRESELGDTITRAIQFENAATLLRSTVPLSL
jgi:predicted TIM-barrel fold metal-dependent hydrolase